MNLTLIQLGIVAAALVWAIARGKSHRKDDCLPLRPDQRIDQWKKRMDDHIGLESEEYLTLLARGVSSKKLRLIALRHQVPASHALVPAGPRCVHHTPRGIPTPGDGHPLGHRQPRRAQRLPRTARGSDTAV